MITTLISKHHNGREGKILGRMAIGFSTETDTPQYAKLAIIRPTN